MKVDEFQNIIPYCERPLYVQSWTKRRSDDVHVNIHPIVETKLYKWVDIAVTAAIKR